MEHEIDGVHTVITARNAALAVGDVSSFLAALAETAVSYDLQPPLAFVGSAAHDAEGVRAWLATWDGPVNVEMRDPAIRVAAGLAAAWGLSHMRGTKKDGEEIELWYRSSYCLAKAGDDWRIVHEHHSVPMMMDGSGLAATHLTPQI